MPSVPRYASSRSASSNSASASASDRPGAGMCAQRCACGRRSLRARIARVHERGTGTIGIFVGVRQVVMHREVVRRSSVGALVEAQRPARRPFQPVRRGSGRGPRSQQLHSPGYFSTAAELVFCTRAAATRLDIYCAVRSSMASRSVTRPSACAAARGEAPADSQLAKRLLRQTSCDLASTQRLVERTRRLDQTTSGSRPALVVERPPGGGGGDATAPVRCAAGPPPLHIGERARAGAAYSRAARELRRAAGQRPGDVDTGARSISRLPSMISVRCTAAGSGAMRCRTPHGTRRSIFFNARRAAPVFGSAARRSSSQVPACW